MIVVRAYRESDLPAMAEIWNEVVEDGVAFPQEELLDLEGARVFFGSQTYCGVAVEISDVEESGEEISDAEEPGEDTPEESEPLGLYILHPNNIGRCGHIANASYAVRRHTRGVHIGEALVADSLTQAKKFGFGVMQFNAVVESNVHARHLYERMGFVPLGIIPKGFRMKDGHYENICPYYHEL